MDINTERLLERLGDVDAPYIHTADGLRYITRGPVVVDANSETIRFTSYPIDEQGDDLCDITLKASSVPDCSLVQFSQLPPRPRQPKHALRERPKLVRRLSRWDTCPAGCSRSSWLVIGFREPLPVLVYELRKPQQKRQGSVCLVVRNA